MNEIYDKQSSTGLFRKWYILEKKSPHAIYDKGQVDDLAQHILTIINPYIDELLAFDREFYRATIPFLYIDYKEFIKFEIDILVIHNTIECLNMPGCVVEGKSLKTAFSNLINAVIQCADARRLRGMWYQNQVFTMQIYNADSEATESKDLITKYIKNGWSDVYDGPYHKVLLAKGNKVTYTISKNGPISSTVAFAYEKLQYQIDAKTHHDLYVAKVAEDDWNCSICDGNAATGCLYFDPTECPR